jgi:hypothetical protein
LTEDEVKEDLARLLTEMAALRDFRVPPHDADPPAVHSALRDGLRPRLDRAEVIMAEVARYRRRARAAADDSARAADDAYDEALAKMSGPAARGGREYESIKDREVLARVKASPLRKQARAAERFADLADEAETAMRGMFFGLRDIRKELLTSLDSYLPWLSHLEQT